MIWSHFWMNQKFFQHRKEIFSYMPLSRYRRRTGCSLGRQPYLVRVRTRGAECWGRYTLEPLSLASCLDLLLTVWPWASCVMTSASVFSCIKGTDWHLPPHRLLVTRNEVNIYMKFLEKRKLFVNVSANNKLALAVGTCHLLLQGLNHMLLQLLTLSTHWRESRVEIRKEAPCALKNWQNRSSDS